MLRKRYLAIALMLIFTIFLSACGNSIENPEKVVANGLNAIKNVDEEKINKYFGSDDILGDTNSFSENEETSRLLFEKLDFKILSSSENDDKATVKAEISNNDMSVIFPQYFQQALALMFGGSFSEDQGEEELAKATEQILLDLIKNNTAMKTTTVDINLTFKEDSWKIDVDDNFADAILGGLISTTNELSQGF